MGDDTDYVDKLLNHRFWSLVAASIVGALVGNLITRWSTPTQVTSCYEYPPIVGPIANSVCLLLNLAIFLLAVIIVVFIVVLPLAVGYWSWDKLQNKLRRK
jgi:uncharacterized membrane protein